jgi:hypothetical protein
MRESIKWWNVKQGSTILAGNMSGNMSVNQTENEM